MGCTLTVMFIACDHCSSTEPAHCCSALSVSHTVLYCTLMLMSSLVTANQKYVLCVFLTISYHIKYICRM